MSDMYQATYDAIRNINIGHYIDQAYTEIKNAGCEMQRPSAIYRPVLNIDGNQWCALYGPNLQEGVCGFGDSPALAMYEFDKAWLAKLNTKAT